MIEHPTLGVWKLRGTLVDPSAIEAARLAQKGAPREKRVLNYGWTTDGKIWIAVRVPEFASSILETESRTSTLYGFSPFVRIAGLDEGDVLKVTFDIGRHTARLEVVDASSLDD